MTSSPSASARQRLERRCPGRDSLRWVYRGSSALAARDGRLPPVPAVAARDRGAVAGPGGRADGVVFALEVFDELDLIDATGTAVRSWSGAPGGVWT